MEEKHFVRLPEKRNRQIKFFSHKNCKINNIRRHSIYRTGSITKPEKNTKKRSMATNESRAQYSPEPTWDTVHNNFTQCLRYICLTN